MRARRDEQRIALIDGLEAFATVEPPRDWRAGNVCTRRGSRTQLGVGCLIWALSLVELGDDGGLNPGRQRQPLQKQHNLLFFYPCRACNTRAGDVDKQPEEREGEGKKKEKKKVTNNFLAGYVCRPIEEQRNAGWRLGWRGEQRRDPCRRCEGTLVKGIYLIACRLCSDVDFGS